MKTTSPTAPAQTPPLQGDFAEAMHAKYVAKDGLAADKRKVLIIPALLLAAGTGLGAAARTGLPPTWATVVTVTLAALIGVFGVAAVCLLHCHEPLLDVGWNTADTCEEKVASSLSPDVRAALAQAQAQVHRRLPAADRVHIYVPDQLPEHPCTLDTTGCRCAGQRLNAAVLPNRSHPIIKVGDRLLDEPAALAYVLAHEINNVRRPGYNSASCYRCSPWSAGWRWGSSSPLPTLAIVAPAVWATTIILNWANEIAADVAARTTGPDAARSYWTMRRTACPTRTGLSRITGAVAAVLAPTHPLMAMRAALADRIAYRTLP
ncbi:hypothetical protein [Actinomadura bangladeshensis]|uniref:Uncharacterized protein n=1 Tax=Actinomadura bangladeshensis TaxID=453573 RepID=A0A6L9QQ83_9ACTN|nr:hypothetical protein [Actinomadura bangladeshensis]NEA27620.1 hypothetical protein [Actinomadura bangladeshensis]